LVETVRKMSKVCREHGVPLAAAALQFSIKDPRVVSTMVGLSRPERIEQTLELAAHPVPDELWSRLEALVPEEQHDPEVSRWT
jgi:D-threo-aldose 1-dehydrogenase